MDPTDLERLDVRMLENEADVTAKSTAVRHLVALGYEDPLEAATRQATVERSQRAQLAGVEELLKAGDATGAVAELESMIDAAADWAAPHQLLARAYYRTGHWRAAAKQLEWLESHGVEHAELALLRAQLALRTRSLEAARDHASYAKALHQPLAAADVLIGDVEFRLGDLAAAEAAYRRAIEVQGPHATALAGLAAVALHRGELAEAIDWSLQAIEQAPKMTTAHFRLGLALWRLQRPQEATAALRTAAALNSQLAGPYRWLTTIATAEGDLAAVENYRRLGQAVVERRRKIRDAKEDL
jgi:tetratricopeptide (TPR) repeat protein